MRIPRNFASREGSEAASNFREAEVRAEYDNEKRPSGYTSWIRHRAKWAQKGKKGQESWSAIEDKKDGDASLPPH